MVDDEDVVDAARHTVRFAGASVLEREAVLGDASQSGADIRDDFLSADDENDMPGTETSGPSWLPLADAIKTDPSSVTV